MIAGHSPARADVAPAGAGGARGHRRELSFSAVVCTYSGARWAQLLATIASLEAQSVPVLEVLVVVDHNAELLERVRRLRGVTAVPARQPGGAAAARNTGAAFARGEVLAFIDDDARAASNWVERLARCYRGQNVIGAGGSLSPDWVDGRPAWFPEGFEWVVGCSYMGMPRAVRPVRNLIAANMSVKREFFMELGGFRPGFGKRAERSGCEETEFCIRALRTRPGAVWLYEPLAEVRHRVPPARASAHYFLRRCYDEGHAKAEMVRMHGRQTGLSAEREHLKSVLPRVLGRSLLGALRLRRAALGRSAAVVAGVVSACVGYSSASLKRLRSGSAASRSADRRRASFR